MCAGWGNRLISREMKIRNTRDRPEPAAKDRPATPIPVYGIAENRLGGGRRG